MAYLGHRVKLTAAQLIKESLGLLPSSQQISLEAYHEKDQSSTSRFEH
jgi:hypothetical protein